MQYLIFSILECGCNFSTSKTPICNISNGICTCKEHYSGSKCTDCATGFVGYPVCQASTTGNPYIYENLIS